MATPPNELIEWTDPTTGESKLISAWAYDMLFTDKTLTKRQSHSLTTMGKPQPGYNRAKTASPARIAGLRANGAKPEFKAKMSALAKKKMETYQPAIAWVKNMEKWVANATYWPGVRKDRNKFQAELQYNGTFHSLGRFDTAEEAIAARKRAEEPIREQARKEAAEEANGR